MSLARLAREWMKSGYDTAIMVRQMVTQRTDARERFETARRRKALEVFNHPATIDDISESLGVNYHTARRITLALLELGQIKPNGNMRDRKVLYIASAKGSGLPSIYNQYGDTHFDIVEYLEGMHDKNFPATSSEVAARAFLTTVLELMHLASVIKEHGSIDSDRLDDVHSNLINSISLLKSTTNMLQQLAEYEVFWTTDGLKRIATSNAFDQIKIDNIYAAYLRLVASNASESQ
jgi:hypothetical protein